VLERVIRDASPPGSPAAPTPAIPPPEALTTPEAFSVAKATTDEPSVPPASDLDVGFFERDPFHALDLDPDVHVTRHALFAAAQARRAHLARYVKGAVAFSTALCVAALMKAAFMGSGAEPIDLASASPPLVAEPRAASARVQETTSIAAAEPASGRADEARIVPPPQVSAAGDDARPELAEPLAPAASASVEPKGSETPVEPTTPTSAPSAPPTPPAAAKPPPPAGSPPPTTPARRPDGPTAAQLREASRFALERGRLGDSVAAGERAVALDPADAEAWLVLGAAYQQRGDATNARRCYKACVDQARRGPRSECASLLR
jgi:tetratricopeptide (TPR) repeat protein